MPAGVEPEVDTVTVVEPEPATDPGLNDAVAPVGRPEALNVTVPLKPLVAVTVAVKVVPLPRLTDSKLESR